MDDRIVFKKDYISVSDVISEPKESVWEIVKRAQHQALCEGINANTILINKNMCKVNSFPFESFGYIRNIPPMICGMNVYFTKDELPENYSFAIMEGPNNRLAEFESIGMEPDELRKAAELYRRVKEVL